VAFREGVRRYRAVLGLPGALRPVVLSALGSIPIGMFVLGILLLARDATGSFADAGRVVGAFGLANAIGAAGQGRLMDRLGQPRVLRAAAVVHLPALAALVYAAREGAGEGALIACALLGGLSLPQLPAAMRSLWGSLVRTDEQRETAYALVSIVFEVSVVTAPAIVAAIVALASPAAAVLTAAALGAFSAVAFTLTHASRSWRGEPHQGGWIGPLRAPAMRAVFLVVGAFGTAVGVVQVLVPAFADERGSVETGGVLLALLSAGSLIGGLVYGARSWPGRPADRLAPLMLGIAAGFALLALADDALLLSVLLLLTGMLFAPATVVASTLLDTAAPPGTVTEAFAVMVMGIVAGTAAGNALGGALVDGASIEAAALAAGAIAALGGAWALARRRTLETAA
jgi:predicted MFS family arabinose efflux permease